MCQATDAFRAMIGIYPYAPGPIPRARVRKPTRHGARGNGHALGLRVPAGPVVEALALEHRLIRQAVADAVRRSARGYG